MSRKKLWISLSLDEKAEIGLKIKEFGEKYFSSVAELSRKLGMKTRQQLYDYIQGKSYPGGELLIKLGKLGCDLNWLLLGENNLHVVKENITNYNVENIPLNMKQDLPNIDFNESYIKAVEAIESLKTDPLSEGERGVMDRFMEVISDLIKKANSAETSRLLAEQKALQYLEDKIHLEKKLNKLELEISILRNKLLPEEKIKMN